MASDVASRVPATASDGRPVVVASVPSGHVYVRHLAAESGNVPHRLPDPDPDDVGRSATQRWWPPAMLDPSWVRGHHFDVFHLHFGFDARSPADLEALLEALQEAGRPLVYTVHDLRNPHHVERRLHDQQLDVLVRGADGLVTLTTGAAQEIWRRWRRRAVVLPHPHVVPLSRMRERTASRPGPRSERSSPAGPFRVGLHVKSLRAGMAPQTLLPALVDVVADLPGAVLQVNAHRDVMEVDGPRHDAAFARQLQRLADEERLELHVHDYLSDDALWHYLESLDVSVLPYRFGTHSGWLEACRDLGTTVIAPTCGYYADQGPVLSYVHDEATFDADSLAGALRRAYTERPQLGASVAERRAERRIIAEAHNHLYRTVLGH